MNVWKGCEMVREVRDLTNIKLTESDAEGIQLHFESGDWKDRMGSNRLSVAVTGLWNSTNKIIHDWARQQLDKQEIAHRRFYLHPQLDKDTLKVLDQVDKIVKGPPSNEFLKEGNEVRTDKPTTRPSPPVDGGY